MRIILVFILFLLLGVSEGKTQRLNDAKTQSEDSASLCLCDSASYYESQIRIADSLYKNYLPQYNFDEVKAAMEFFDSLRLSMDNGDGDGNGYGDGNGDGNNIPLPTPTSASDSAIRLQNPILLCAKAHYYHAVGLTEKDDIVGACEHYLIALEIMEEMMAKDKRLRGKGKGLKVKGKKSVDYCPLSVDNPEDYEKIRFVALICNRLGRLFYNESYCDLAIIKYRKAIDYVNLINDNSFKANLLKELANSYHLANNADSALCYYNKSLETNSNLTNKLDVEKCIAQILFYKGEKDSAYILIKNNIDKIVNYGSKDSYYCILGTMYYKDNVYDSAIYYIEKSFTSENISVKISSAINLSAIYDSIMDYDKKVYYDNFISKHTIKYVNKSVERSKFQYVYEKYKERKQEKIKSITKTRSIISCCIVIIIVFSIIITIRYKHRKQNDKLSEEIKAKNRHIKHNEFKNTLIEGKIKSKNAELQQKDKQIKSQQLKIAELQSKLENRKDNLKEYFQSEICVKILNEIRELSKSNKTTSDLKPLSQEEFVLLLQSANMHLGEFIKNISNRYPSFKKDDLYYLCLVTINLNDKQIAALFNVSYNAIRSRRKKICTILDIDINENIYKKLMI